MKIISHQIKILLFEIGTAISTTGSGRKKISLFLYCSLVLSFNSTFAQPAIEWQATRWSGQEDNIAYSVQQTADGGYIAVGNAYLNNYGDPRAEEFLIIKYDGGGEKEWETIIGEQNRTEIAHSVQQTSDGGYIVAGMTTSGGINFWIVKLDESGEVEWDKILGGSETDVPSSIRQTTDGGFIVAGYTTSDDGDVSANNGIYDFWITKLNDIGDIEWEKSLGGTANEKAHSVRQTSDGGYIVAGYAESNDGDVSENHGGRDFWITKLSTDGSIEWEKSLGTENNDVAYSVIQTSDSGYIVAGGTGTSSYADGGCLIVKLNNSGEVMWEKAYLDAGASTYARSIEETSDGGYIMAGTNYSPFPTYSGDFPHTSGNGALVVKLDENGDMQWFNRYIGGISLVYSIQQTSDKGYIFAGTYESGTAGAKVFWVVKLEGDQGPLKISNQSFSIGENSPEGTVVGQIEAESEEDGELTFSIVSGNTGDAFAIDAATGKLTVRSALDHETTPSFVLVIQISDGSHSAQATIAVTIIDQGDTSPGIKKRLSYNWLATFGGRAIVHDVKTDMTDNIYALLSFYETVDFDPGEGVNELTAATGGEMALLKLTAEGKFIWAKKYKGTGGTEMEVDEAANIYFTGRFTGKPSNNEFGLTSGLYNGSYRPDAFVCKLDSAGNFIWVKQMGGSNSDSGNLIRLDAEGNVIVAGSFSSEDFNPGGPHTLKYSTELNRPATFISKFDSDGNYLGATYFKASGDFDEASRIQTSAIVPGEAGSIYVAGNFNDYSRFSIGSEKDTVLLPAYDPESEFKKDNIFLVKLGSNVQTEWAKRITPGLPADMMMDKEGNLVMYGAFFNHDGNADFDPSEEVHEVKDEAANIFIAKYSQEGGFQYVKTLAASATSGPGDLEMDDEGNMFLSGYRTSPLDMDPGPEEHTLSLNSESSFFILKLDAEGNYEYAYKFLDGPRSGNGSLLEKLKFHGPERLYLAGSFDGTYDFDPGIDANLITSENQDGFLLSLMECEISDSILDIEACESYSLNDETYTQSGIYIQNFKTTLGCDSLVTLNLTIQLATDLDATLTMSGEKLTATASGVTYQWLSCNDGDYLEIEGETAQSFFPPESGTYAVEVSNGACSAVSECIEAVVLGLADNSFSKKIRVFPNPASQEVEIVWPEPVLNATITIYSVTGKKLVFLEGISGKSHTSDLSTLPPGLLFVEIKELDKTGVIRLLKE